MLRKDRTGLVGEGGGGAAAGPEVPPSSGVMSSAGRLRLRREEDDAGGILDQCQYGQARQGSCPTEHREEMHHHESRCTNCEPELFTMSAPSPPVDDLEPEGWHHDGAGEITEGRPRSKGRFDSFKHHHQLPGSADFVLTSLYCMTSGSACVL